MTAVLFIFQIKGNGSIKMTKGTHLKRYQPRTNREVPSHYNFQMSQKELMEFMLLWQSNTLRSKRLPGFYYNSQNHCLYGRRIQLKRFEVRKLYIHGMESNAPKEKLKIAPRRSYKAISDCWFYGFSFGSTIPCQAMYVTHKLQMKPKLYT